MFLTRSMIFLSHSTLKFRLKVGLSYPSRSSSTSRSSSSDSRRGHLPVGQTCGL